MKFLKFVLWSIVSLALLAGGIAAAIWYFVFSPAINITENQQLTLKRTDNLQSLTEKLTETCGLKYPRIFYLIAERMNVEKNLRAGKFEITPNMNNKELAVLFRKGGTFTTNIVIRGSWDLRNIPTVLGNNLEPDPDSFKGVLDNSAYLSKFGFNNKTVAAMFIPNTYNMYWFSTTDEVLSRFYKEYQHFWNKERSAKADSLGLTPLQVSILASILDKETNQVSEMPRIAGVYLNRLNEGWKLQADPTVKYALDSMTMTRIYIEHTLIESPYNTYFIAGLPPAPICIPSVQAIDAVLNREQHDLMYFCAKPDFSGFHVFAKTLDEHNRNANLYHRFLNKLDREKAGAKK